MFFAITRENGNLNCFTICYVFNCVSMCVYTCVYRVLVITVALRGQEGMGLPGVGVPNACELELPMLVSQVICAGTIPRSFAKGIVYF